MVSDTTFVIIKSIGTVYFNASFDSLSVSNRHNINWVDIDRDKMWWLVTLNLCEHLKSNGSHLCFNLFAIINIVAFT